MTSQRLIRGSLAREAGVHGETIRYYEKRDLLKEPARSAGYRECTPEIVQRVRFIKRAQELGFTLVEVQELLSLKANRRRGSGEVKVLARLVAVCDGDGPIADCPIIAAMEDE